MQTPTPANTPAAHIEAMLLATGRFDGATSALMARWTQAFYATMAARTGTTPQALYERLPLKITGRAAGTTDNKLSRLKRSGTALAKAEPPLPHHLALERAIRLVHEDARLWSILLDESEARSGPSDGACLICAKAIILAAGRGELVRLVSDVSEGQTEHYGVRLDGVIHDFNGSYSTPEAWVREFSTLENIQDRQLTFASGHDEKATEIPDDPRASRRVARLLSEQLANITGAGVKAEAESQAFTAWLGDSKVVDAKGRPLAVYHATFEDFEVFAMSTDLGYHFGTAQAANDRLKHEGKKAKNRDRAARIIPAYLNIRRPAVLADQITWSAPSLAKALLQGGYITSEQAKPVLDGTVDQSGPDPAGAFHRHLVKALKANGYDGIKYRNLVEGTTRGLGDIPIENLIEVVPNEWFGKGSDAPFTARFKDTRYPVGGAKGATPEETLQAARKVLARRKNALDYSFIVFDSNQVKATIGNDGSFDRDDPNILSQSSLEDPPTQRSPLGLYSGLARSIDGEPIKSAPAAAWKTAIKGLLNKGAVKQDELEWSGLEDWMDLQQGKISKEQVEQYLKEGGVRVEETVLGGFDKGWRLTPDDGGPGMVYDEDNLDELEADKAEFGGTVTEIKIPKDGDTKYSQYTLPGGKNYREVLLTLPDAGEARFRELEEKISSRRATPAERNEYNNWNGAKREGVYRSKHWNQTNVLAHIRVNDRTDADGGKVLFVEEIQSDWGQQGKKQGFDLTASDLMAKPFDGGMVDRWEVLNKKTGQRVAMAMGQSEQEAIQNGLAQAPGACSAPFVTKTESWLTLALKRVITLAAEEGYDKVAFVDGEQSVSRYHLSKRVDAVRYGRSSADKPYSIGLKRKGESQWDDAGLHDAHSLPAVVGKEIAGKIVNSGQKQGELDGIDLKLGGEGMKTFYDRIVPSALKNLLNKLDPQSLGAVHFPGRMQIEERLLGFAIYDPQTKMYFRGGDSDRPWVDYPNNAKHFATQAAARKAVVKVDSPMGVSPSQPGFRLTPLLREKALQGLPLFQRQGREAEPRGTFDPRTLEIALGPQADASTWIHETGHFFLEALSELASQPNAPESVVRDMNRVLDWFGVQGTSHEERPALPQTTQRTQRTALQTWMGMTLEQKRPFHEQWARAMEQYVLEGKAPSEELRPVVESFSAWLRAIYVSTRDFLDQAMGGLKRCTSTRSTFGPSEALFRKALADQQAYTENPRAWFESRLHDVAQRLAALGVEAFMSGNGRPARFFSADGEVRASDLAGRAGSLAQLQLVQLYERINAEYDAAEAGTPPQFMPVGLDPNIELMPMTDRQRVVDLLTRGLRGELPTHAPLMQAAPTPDPGPRRLTLTDDIRRVMDRMLSMHPYSDRDSSLPAMVLSEQARDDDDETVDPSSMRMRA